MPKTYTINEKQYTIAMPSSQRMAKFCELVEFDSFKMFQKIDAQRSIDLVTSILDVAMSADLAPELLACCVSEDASMITDVPMKELADIASNFFSHVVEIWHLQLGIPISIPQRTTQAPDQATASAITSENSAILQPEPAQHSGEQSGLSGNSVK